MYATPSLRGWTSINACDVDVQVLQSLTLPEPGAGKPKASAKATLLYCERFVELLVDLLSQLPTRRFTRVLLEDSALLVKVQHAALLNHTSGQLFAQLVDLFAFYMSKSPAVPAHMRLLCQ